MGIKNGGKFFQFEFNVLSNYRLRIHFLAKDPSINHKINIKAQFLSKNLSEKLNKTQIKHQFQFKFPHAAPYAVTYVTQQFIFAFATLHITKDHFNYIHQSYHSSKLQFQFLSVYLFLFFFIISIVFLSSSSLWRLSKNI